MCLFLLYNLDMIWNINYINLYLSARKNLNYQNIEKLSSDQIKHIGKMYSEEEFNHFKKKIFFRWFSENSKNELSFLKRTKKLIKKIDIILTDTEALKINSIESREFTLRRVLKTIEVPYKKDSKSILLNSNAYFFYKDMRTCYKKLNFIDVKYYGEIYITSTELVLYNREENKIQKVIYHRDIEEIILRSYCVLLKVRNEKDIYLRYQDNELIYISLNRSIRNKNEIDFKNESKIDGDTTERTIELVLNIGNKNHDKRK